MQSSGYQVTLCENCEKAVACSGEEYGVIILDITLPDGNGFDLYKDIRRVNNAPVIFLTALDDEDNIVNGLEMGAADYITKPFSARELLARIRRFDKRSKGESTVISVGEISADTEKHIVSCGGEAKVPFEPKEGRAVYCSECFAKMNEA